MKDVCERSPQQIESLRSETEISGRAHDETAIDGGYLQRGQATVEFVALLPVWAFLVTCAVQAMMFALGCFLVQAAADRVATSKALGVQVRASDMPIPTAFRHGWSAKQLDSGRWRVTIRVPSMFPGVSPR